MEKLKHSLVTFMEDLLQLARLKKTISPTYLLPSMDLLTKIPENMKENFSSIQASNGRGNKFSSLLS